MAEWKYPGHLIYSYYKPRGGWYPSVFGGWTRGPYCIKVYLEEDDAIAACPKDCEVILIQIEFKKKWRYLTSQPSGRKTAADVIVMLYE